MRSIRVHLLVLLLLLVAPVASAALVTNPGIAITRQVTIQPIVVSNDNGANASVYFGSPANTAAIQDSVGVIWSQAGIDVRWLIPNFFQNTIANVGSLPTNTERPVGDLDAILNAGQAAGVASANPKTLNFYFIRITPGFPMLSAGSVAGRSQVDNTGGAMFVGSNLPGLLFNGDPLGNNLIAKTIAHEIGHNLGLEHFNTDTINLLHESGSTLPTVGATLNSDQIVLARSSRFAVAVPEPSTWAGLAAAFGVFIVGRTKERVGRTKERQRFSSGKKS